MLLRVTVFLLLLSPSLCHAGVLFLDLNQNDSTIRAVSRVEGVDATSVYVYPTREFPTISVKTIGPIIEDVAERARQNNDEVEWIIFSGHSGNGRFSGKNGELDTVFHLTPENLKAIKGSVKGLILRGCYSAVFSQVISTGHWRKHFPRLNYIAGYYGRAWSSESRLSQNFVSDALIYRQTFLLAATNSTRIGIFQQFRNYEKSELAIWFSNAINQEYYLTTDRIKLGKISVDFEQEKRRCEKLRPQFTRHSEIARRYYEARDGYESPPADTHHSELREAYSFFQAQNQCTQLLKVWKARPYSDPRVLQTLVFQKNLIGNLFAHANLTRLNQLSQPFLKEQARKTEANGNVQSSRRELIDWHTSLQAILLQKWADIPESERVEWQYYLEVLDHALIAIRPAEIPQRWLTDVDSSALSISLAPYEPKLELTTL